MTNFNWSDIYGFASYGYYVDDMVIYDVCNIDINKTPRGLFLNYKEDTTVYKCKKCGNIVNLELFDDTKCNQSHCEFDK